MSLRCVWSAFTCRGLRLAAGTRGVSRRSPAPAAAGDFADVGELFGDPTESGEARGPNSRTSSKKRSEEFRKLGRDLVTLPPKTLTRMSLPSDLLEAIQEHTRIESKRGSGSVKKGRARVEALMAQILRSYEPEKSARIEAATRSALAGEPFSPIEPVVERPRAHMHPKRKDDSEIVEALAQLWHRGLLDGDAKANADVFGVLARQDDTWTGPDRVALRQLIVKAQAEERDAADAVAAAAAASVEGSRPAVRRPSFVVGTQLLAALKQLAAASLDDNAELEAMHDAGDEKEPA